MCHIALLSLMAATISCDDTEKHPIGSAPNADALRQSSSNWFPNMEVKPPIVPLLPDDFVPGFVTNKVIGDGKPTLVWGRAEDIERLNQGATVTPPVFTIIESIKEPSSNIITPADREEFISNYKAFGFSNIKCGSRKIDGWTFDWFSGELSSDQSFAAWLSRPDQSGTLWITLIASENGFPIWENFINSIESSEQNTPSGQR